MRIELLVIASSVCDRGVWKPEAQTKDASAQFLELFRKYERTSVEIHSSAFRKSKVKIFYEFCRAEIF